MPASNRSTELGKRHEFQSLEAQSRDCSDALSSTTSLFSQEVRNYSGYKPPSTTAELEQSRRIIIRPMRQNSAWDVHTKQTTKKKQDGDTSREGQRDHKELKPSTTIQTTAHFIVAQSTHYKRIGGDRRRLRNKRFIVGRGFSKLSLSLQPLVITTKQRRHCYQQALAQQRIKGTSGSYRLHFLITVDNTIMPIQ